jgi:hypothetical protein
MAPYKVMRAFERWEGKALRKYTRGSIISAKDAAKMAIRPAGARASPLETLVNAGNIFMLPDDHSQIHTQEATP